MNPKISIIVPVYNVEQILRYCVDSICKQSFSDFEILLIDDGSKDNSGKICDELSTFDSRIKVFHKQNGGLSDARNFGIDKSVGDFLLFIDSDDVLHKDFCKVLIEMQEKYNAEITSTDLVNFYDFSEIEELNSKSYNYETYVYKNLYILSEYFKPKDKIKIYHGLCMKLYKRELFNNLRFDKGRLHEDLFITYKLLDKTETFVFINLPYYYYYQKNSNSITKNYREKNLFDEFDSLILMMDFFKDKKEIYNSLYYFVINHMLYLWDRSFCIPKNQNVLQKRKEIKKIIIDNVSLCTNFSKKQKIKIYVKLRFYYLYKLLFILKNGIKNVK